MRSRKEKKTKIKIKIFGKIFHCNLETTPKHMRGILRSCNSATPGFYAGENATYRGLLAGKIQYTFKV